MNNLNELKRRNIDKHPAFGSYLECMSRALLTGVSTFTIAFSGTYLTQTLLKKQLPYSRNGFILISSVVAVGTSYYITTTRTKVCQAAWMAAEDRHTYLTDISNDTE